MNRSRNQTTPHTLYRLVPNIVSRLYRSWYLSNLCSTKTIPRGWIFVTWEPLLIKSKLVSIDSIDYEMVNPCCTTLPLHNSLDHWLNASQRAWKVLREKWLAPHGNHPTIHPIGTRAPPDRSSITEIIPTNAEIVNHNLPLIGRQEQHWRTRKIRPTTYGGSRSSQAFPLSRNLWKLFHQIARVSDFHIDNQGSICFFFCSVREIVIFAILAGSVFDFMKVKGGLKVVVW